MSFVQASNHSGAVEAGGRVTHRGRAVVLGVILLAAFASIGRYNELVRLDQDVQAQWGQVENVYQRRADLIPILVETVKGEPSLQGRELQAWCKRALASFSFRARHRDTPPRFRGSSRRKTSCRPPSHGCWSSPSAPPR